MLPATDNLELYRGDTVRERRHFEIPDTDPVQYYDPTGCTAAAQVRVSKTDDTILYSFDCELFVGATATDPSGVIMEIEAGLTDDAPTKAVWDWQVTFPDTALRTFGAGTVKFSGQVTR